MSTKPLLLHFKYRRNGTVGLPWKYAHLEVESHNKGIFTLDSAWLSSEETFNFVRLFQEYIIDVSENTMICSSVIASCTNIQLREKDDLSTPNNPGWND